MSINDIPTVRSLDWSPDGTRIAYTASGGSVCTADSLTVVTHLQDDASAMPVFDIRWSPDSNMLLTRCHDKTVRIWSAQTGQCIRTLAGHTGHVSWAAFASHGHLIASCGADGMLRIWDAAIGTPLSTTPVTDYQQGRAGRMWANKNFVHTGAWSPAGDLIATASVDGSIRIWSLH